MKKKFVILVLLSSLLFVYTSCKDDDYNNNCNIDLYSSKDMEGTYLYSFDCDCQNFDYNMWRFLYVLNITKDSFVISQLRGSYFYDFTMHKEGNIFYEKNIVYSSSLLHPPYHIKGNIKYINSTNPYYPYLYRYYEFEGSYYSDTNFQIPVGKFCMKQISHDTVGFTYD